MSLRREAAKRNGRFDALAAGPNFAAAEAVLLGVMSKTAQSPRESKHSNIKASLVVLLLLLLLILLSPKYYTCTGFWALAPNTIILGYLEPRSK